MTDFDTILVRLQRGYHPQGHHPRCTTLADEGCDCYARGTVEARAALARVKAASEQTEQTLPADKVCACLDETGGRQVRIFERCERCHALTESDLPEQLDAAERLEDEWERTMTYCLADASRRADEWQERAERAERERDDAAESADEWREQWERAEARIGQAEKTLEQIAEGPTWRSFTPADVARAALKLLRGKDTR